MRLAPGNSTSGTDARRLRPRRARRVLLGLAAGTAIALSLIAAGLTSPPSAATPVQPVRDTIHGQHVGLLVPSRPNGVLVIAAHGHGDTVNAWLSGARQASVRRALLHVGYSLAAGDGAGAGWGNAQSIAAYTNLYTWATQRASSAAWP